MIKIKSALLGVEENQGGTAGTSHSSLSRQYVVMGGFFDFREMFDILIAVGER